MTAAASTVAEALARFRNGETTPTPTPTPTPTRTRTGKATRTPYTRPNGETYYARTVPDADHDIDLLRRSIGTTPQDNIHVLTWGQPGCGKNAAIESAFPDLVTIPGDEDTTVDDFMGTWIQNPDGSYQWIDGPIPHAAEHGLPVLVDEIAVISPRVLTCIYPAMDGRGTITIKTNPHRGTITIKPGFTILGAYNPGAPGARISDALLSRFTLHIEYTTDLDLAKHLGVDPRFITITKNILTKNSNGDNIWTPQMRDLLDTKKITERYGLNLAISNLIGRAPAHDRPIIADLVSRKFGIAATPLTTGTSNLTTETTAP